MFCAARPEPPGAAAQAADQTPGTLVRTIFDQPDTDAAADNLTEHG
jgi:hypothetical protein